MNHIRRTEIITVISVILIFVATVVFSIMRCIALYESPMTQYNNGIHADDGGRWTYDGFVIAKNRSRYSYHCDTCGRSIVLDEWRK